MTPLMGLYEDYDDIFQIKNINFKIPKLFSLKNLLETTMNSILNKIWHLEHTFRVQINIFWENLLQNFEIKLEGSLIGS